jgi:Zn-dependent protease
MFGKTVTLFRIFGFEVKIDWSWLILGALIIWSLATGLFPAWYEGLAPSQYWAMGVAGALGLFVSIVFHEFWHSLIARKFGLDMKGITLFLFGGVAEMGDEPPSPRAEFFLAVAGPISSVVLAGAILGLSLLLRGPGPVTPVTGVLRYLGYLNFILAGFNLLPAFPLDGGRVLRAVLWGLGRPAGAASPLRSAPAWRCPGPGASSFPGRSAGPDARHRPVRRAQPLVLPAAPVPPGPRRRSGPEIHGRGRRDAPAGDLRREARRGLHL